MFNYRRVSPWFSPQNITEAMGTWDPLLCYCRRQALGTHPPKDCLSTEPVEEAMLWGIYTCIYIYRLCYFIVCVYIYICYDIVCKMCIYIYIKILICVYIYIYISTNVVRFTYNGSWTCSSSRAKIYGSPTCVSCG